LKLVHGALWDQHNEWVIHLKKDDPLNQKRYTLFHEVFHIMARNTMQKGQRVKHKMRGGLFYELLADHFATSVLMPVCWVTEKWDSLQDLDRLAHIFRVPKQVAFIRLRRLSLI
jgi:Zn-dependent peptidase ImmA (M78 family)